MFDLQTYIALAGLAWFLGFFPLAEIFVAVATVRAAGLDGASTLFWSILGNFTPVLLIYFGYEQLRRVGWLQRWLDKLASEKLRGRVNQYGMWFVLIMTPWVGVWAMTLAGRLLGMDGTRLLASTLVSISVHAVATLLLLEAGISAFSGA